MSTLRKHAHLIYRLFSKVINLMDFLILFFLFFAQNIDCGYTLELRRRGGSNEYPQWSKNKKNRYMYSPAYPSFAI